MNIEDIEVEKPLKIVFMGTPKFSVPILDVLIDNYGVKAVVTQTDKRVGRKGDIVFPPVKEEALKHNILVIQLEKLKESYQEIIDLDPDLIVTCAYGQILPKELLDYPRLGCINVHASLLPKLRGGAPIHRAIINGEKKTGITIMYMAPGMDDGDIIATEAIDITDTDTASTLHDKLSVLGSKLLLQTLPSIIDGTNERTPQNPDEVTFAPIIKKEDEKLDFNKTSIQIYNQIRGLNSFPGAYFILNGKRFKVFESVIVDEYSSLNVNGEIVKTDDMGIYVKTSNGVIVLTVIQPEGKSRMRSKDYLNGIKDSLVGNVVE
ncbi:MAG: methionyl-tRNA formyltransferase [bacterium]|nr:methionyl-tRNA formyltransferase [bacterium]